MNRILFLAACLAVSAGALAEDAMTTPAEAFNAGKAFANSGKAAAGGAVNTTTGSETLPHYSTTAPETGHYGGGRSLIGTAGTSKMTECQSYQAPSAFEQQECEAVNFLARNPAGRPRYTIDPATDPLLIGSKIIVKNPGSVPGAPTQQCRVESVVTPGTYSTETCTETLFIEDRSCSRVLTVACDPARDGCDQGGIVPNSWAGDMVTSFTPDGAGNYALQFGTIADNYWCGGGIVVDRTLTFDVRDLNLVTFFTLTRAAFDDWILVRVNDSLVYVGPYGGDRLEIYRATWTNLPSGTNCWWNDPGYSCYQGDFQLVGTYSACRSIGDWSWSCSTDAHLDGRVQYGANKFGYAELGTSWDQRPNINLKPYLREGSNTIFMRVIVAGCGEGAIQIMTRQLCPRECHDHWDDSQCAALDARAQ